MKDDYYWLKLIKAWEATSSTSTPELTTRAAGLTFPYLVGAKTLIENGFKPTSYSASELLEEIINASIPEIVIELRFCANPLNSHVFGIHHTNDISDNTAFKNLLVRKTILNHTNSGEITLSQIVLTPEIVEAIERGNYSRDETGAWRPYSADESTFIMEVLNKV